MKSLILTAVLIWVVALCGGCASINPGVSNELKPNINIKQAADARLYQIYIGSEGELLNPVTQEPIADEGAYIDSIFENFNRISREKPSLQLTIFIHGGLNTFEAATKRVDRVKDAMLQDGTYPLFISWDSGALGNYSDHLFLLRRGIRSPKLGPLSSPFVLAEDLLRAIARLPASTYNVIFGQNSIRIGHLSLEEKAAKASYVHLESEAKFQFHNSPNDTGHKFPDFWSLANPVKLVTAPLVDGLGTGAWNSMLRRTDLVLRKRTGFDGIAGDKAATAASAFLKRWQTDQRYRDRPVTLVGHSMGTIIANNIVSKYQRIKFSKIIYMAAACTTKDLEYVIAPYLERHEQAEFYNLSLNPYRDINENIYFDMVPRGSLLMWIDQTLANVNSFQDRTAGFWFNIVRSANQIFEDDDVRRRVHLTQFGISDGSPREHGDFGKYPFWREQFWIGKDIRRIADVEDEE